MEQNQNQNDGSKGDAQTNQPTPAELEIQKKLGSLDLVVQQLSEQAKLGEMLKGDSDFQEFMKLKASGKKVAIQEKADKPYDPLAELLSFAEEADRKVSSNKKDDEEGETKSNLSDPKELLRILGTKLPEMIQATLENSTKPLVAKIAQLEQETLKSRAESERQNLDKEVTEASRKYPDLGTYQKDIVELSKSIAEKGGLSVEQLYLLTKAGKIGLPDRGVESEYPTNVLSSRARASAEKVRHGHAGFEAALGEALSKRFG